MSAEQMHLISQILVLKWGGTFKESYIHQVAGNGSVDLVEKVSLLVWRCQLSLLGNVFFRKKD